ncbi:hypothetical protein BJX64DRAFT_257810 [Aspergillus heterothallicus]
MSVFSLIGSSILHDHQTQSHCWMGEHSKSVIKPSYGIPRHNSQPPHFALIFNFLSLHSSVEQGHIRDYRGIMPYPTPGSAMVALRSVG